MFADIIVVGAGLAGCVSSRILADNGFSVLLVEKRKHVAGQCYDYKNQLGITVHQYGPHIFHTNDRSIWDYVNRFADFNGYQHRVLSYINGGYVPYPVNRNTINNLFGTCLSNDEIQAFLKEKASPFTQYSNDNFAMAVKAQIGEALYHWLVENYTRSQWECEPEELSAELAGRIPVRHNGDGRYFTDKYQGLPIGGYTKMIEKILDHKNIKILMGCDYFEIADQIQADLTVYTGELDRFFDYRSGRLEYRSVRIDQQDLLLDEFQPAAVVNYPNDYDYTRITEFKKMTLEQSKHTTICYEYPLASGDPFYVVPSQDNMRKRDGYLNEVQRLESQGKHLFIGRLAQYCYYNMDEVISSAIYKSNEWLEKQI
mgnify:CR=1 FL=1